jgi:hypothetical protein
VIVLLDTSESLDVCAKELGCECEQLLTPLTRFRRQKPFDNFAIDNGAFSAFDPNAFRQLIAREAADKTQCRFVAVPDVVGSARRTREVFGYWYGRLGGWNVAYVAQDGQEDVEIPWHDIAAIFIGGSTEFKMGKRAVEVIKAAKAMEKWIHVGRVNTPGRFEYFENLGVNSIDGTGLSRFSWMRESIYRRETQGSLLQNQV